MISSYRLQSVPARFLRPGQSVAFMPRAAYVGTDTDVYSIFVEIATTNETQDAMNFRTSLLLIPKDENAFYTRRVDGRELVEYQ